MTQGTANTTRDREAGYLKVVLIYAAFAAFWILLSDELLARLFHDPDTFASFSIVKGWLFVAFTSLLLYGLLRRTPQGPAMDMASASPPNRGHGLILALILALVSLLTVLGANRAIQREREVETARITAIANAKATQITDWLSEKRLDASYLRTDREVARLYRKWLANPDSDASEFIEHLRGYSRLFQFSSVSLLDTQGETLWRDEKSAGKVSQDVASAAREASTRGEIRYHGPYMDARGIPRLDILTPLAIVGGPAPIVILHIDLPDRLYPTLKSWPVPSRSAEILVFRQEGNQVLYLNDLRHRQASALRQRVSMNTPGLLAAMVLRDPRLRAGVLHGVDYRGIPVVGVSRAITGTDWYLVAKMDLDELDENAREEAIWIVLAGVLTIFLAFIGIHLMRKQQQLAVSEATRLAQSDRLNAMTLLSSIADSSGDAIFAKDMSGRYLLFNRAAERLTGKMAEEVLGKDDFFLFPKEEAEYLHTVGERVIAGAKVVDEIEVLSTNIGKRIFITTKGPLHDECGAVIGHYGISRDITERRAAEEREAEVAARFRQLLETTRDGIVIINQEHRVVEANRRFCEMLGYTQAEISTLYTWDYDANMCEASIREQFHDLTKVSGEFVTRHRRKDGSVYDVEISANGAVWSGKPLVLCICREISERKAAEVAAQRHADELNARNLQLERFNRAMVGRELDMIKLKQRINALSIELGRDPPYAMDRLAPHDPNRPS